MEGMIRTIMGLLATLVGLYSLLIIIRIILTWFSNGPTGRLVEMLARVTDPYLDWWRQRFTLRAGMMDLSPLAAIVSLSILQTIFSMIATYGRVSLGVVLAVCVSAIWSAASFLLFFCLLVLVLRLIAYVLNSNMFSTFWRIIDSISRPLLYRIGRIIFGNRLVGFLTGMFAAIAVLAIVSVLGHIFMPRLATLLSRLPV